MNNKHWLELGFLGLGLLCGLASCSTPTPLSTSTPSGSGRSLEVTWQNPNTAAFARTVTPVYPTCTNFTVTMVNTATSATYKTWNQSGGSFQLNNVPSAVYSLTVDGKDAKSVVVASGTATVDLTAQSSVSLALTLTYVTTGTGTGSLTINPLTTGVTGTISGYTLQLTGSTTTTASFTSTTTLSSLAVGVYQLLLTATKTDGSKAYSMETAVVVPDTTTVWNIPLSDSMFGTTYIPVSALSGVLSSTTLTIGSTATLTLTWNSASSTPSNPTWTSKVVSGSTSTATLDASGLVTALQGGQVTFQITSVDNPNVSTQVSVDVQPQLIYNSNFGTAGGSGSAPSAQQGDVGTTLTVASATGLTSGGRLFTGWNTSADGTGTVYAPGSSFTLTSTNTTLYAQWGASGVGTLTAPSALPSLVLSFSPPITLGVPTTFGVTISYGTSTPTLTALSNPVYQWLLNGKALSDQPGQIGTQTSTLMVSPFSGTWQVGANEITVEVTSSNYPMLSASQSFLVNPASSKDAYSPTIGTLKYVPGGTFFNGTANMSVSDMVMSQNLITGSQYAAIMGNDPSFFLTVPEHPVSDVSWYDALVFCNKLSLKEGLTPVYSINGSTDPNLWGIIPTTDASNWDDATMNYYANGYRLPTEAEYEWAAMGGMSDGLTIDIPPGNINQTGYLKGYAGSKESGGGTQNAVNFEWCLANDTTFKVSPIGTKLPNEFGIYDLSGNSWEWCWDNYATPWTTSAQINYMGASSSSFKSIKGGSFGDAPYALNNRNTYSSYDNTDIMMGFRVVRSLTTIPGFGLLGEWKLNNTWNDTSGNSLTLTPTGTVSFVTGHRGTNTAASFSTGSFSSTSSNNTVLTFSSSNSVAISFWMEDVGAAIGSYPVLCNGTGNSVPFGVFKSTANQLTGFFGAFPSYQVIPYTPNVWQHIVWQWDASTSTASFYLNGKLVSPTSNASLLTPPAPTNTSLTVGAPGYILDDVRIYNRTLSPAEIEALYEE